MIIFESRISGKFPACWVRNQANFRDLQLTVSNRAAIMVEKDNGLKRYLFERRFLILLILCFTSLLVGPFIGDYHRLRYLFDLVVSVIFLSAMFAIIEKMRQLLISVCLAVPMLVAMWAKYLFESRALAVSGEICGVLFFAYAIIHIVKHMLKQEEVTRETIFAALVIYMLAAFMWARIYSLLEILQPGSFSMPAGHFFGDRLVFLYYSFVTITTLGYGDITPLTDKASALSIIEAISGQIYLVVLVAWLVGMHVSRRSK